MLIYMLYKYTYSNLNIYEYSMKRIPVDSWVNRINRASIPMIEPHAKYESNQLYPIGLLLHTGIQMEEVITILL